MALLKKSQWRQFVKWRAIQGARELIDITKGHIDGCILAHDANLIFAEKMYQLGAKNQYSNNNKCNLS
jgi:predicted aconitase